jgi:hypothetical protein
MPRIVPVASFAELEAELLERTRAIVWCNVATVDSRNRPRSRILHPIWEGATGWIATRRNTLKADHLARSPYVSLAYVADIWRPLYVDCLAAWDDAPESKRRVWISSCRPRRRPATTRRRASRASTTPPSACRG